MDGNKIFSACIPDVVQSELTRRGAAPIMRKFETGATRSSDVGKLDYEGCLSPEVLEMFATYMNRHCTQADGAPRASDNWKKGMPREKYMKSLLRHIWDAWKIHQGLQVVDSHTGTVVTIDDALCAALFNVQGYLFEKIHGR